MTLRPNIIYLHTHDTGRHIQPYGAPVPTPRIQRLAEEGVLFLNAFSAAPTCSPSRAGLLTGSSPHSCGMLGLAHRGFTLHDYGQHLVNTLAPAGYHTAMVGQQHVAPGPREGEVIGYDEQLLIEGERAAVVIPAALDFLDRTTDRPFFLSIGLVETHTLTSGTGTFGYPGTDDRYVAPPPTMPSLPETRSDMASFAAAARVVDDGVGAVLDRLAAQGLLERTLVVLTTDHGVAMPGMKATLTDLGTGVMLIIRGPGGFTGGRVIEPLVTQLDLFPTLCDLLGLDRPDWLEGTSLLPLLTGETQSLHDVVFSEVNYHVSYEPMRAARTTRWKYIRQFSDWGRPVLANVDDSPSKQVWLDGGWRDHPVAHEQLYDLLFDRWELHNLAADPAYADVLATLGAELRSWMERTNDPLLVGPLPPPPGPPPLSQAATSPDE
jgi:arylsulfatase A-like enzyme